MTDLTLHQRTAGWHQVLGLRLRRLLVLKMVGTSVFITLFFMAYFHLLRHPAHPVFMMPRIELDLLIPFQPQFLFPYLSLWLYVGIAPGLQLSFAELLVYGLWIGALCLTGLAIFYVWPTAVPPLAIDVSGFAGFQMLQGVDATGNACPSMHVAVAIFTVVRLEEILRESRAPMVLRVINQVWFFSIVWSTVAIRQHVVLDTLAGALLGLVFVLPSLRWRPLRLRAGTDRAGADIIKRMPQNNVP